MIVDQKHFHRQASTPGGAFSAEYSNFESQAFALVLLQRGVRAAICVSGKTVHST